MTKMIKKILVIMLLLQCVGLFAGTMDVIVMIDTSSSMEPYFDSLLNYLFTRTLNNFLQPGDRFHLLCFSSVPTVELMETLDNDKTALAIRNKISGLKGRLIFGKYTDLLSALDLLLEYSEGLQDIDNKRILLLSDGIHDPPPGSPYYGITVAGARRQVHNYVQEIIEKNGWSIRILRMPTERTSLPEKSEDINLLENIPGVDPETDPGENSLQPANLSDPGSGLPGSQDPAQHPTSQGSDEHQDQTNPKKSSDPFPGYPVEGDSFPGEETPQPVPEATAGGFSFQDNFSSSEEPGESERQETPASDQPGFDNDSTGQSGSSGAQTQRPIHPGSGGHTQTADPLTGNLPGDVTHEPTEDSPGGNLFDDLTDNIDVRIIEFEDTRDVDLPNAGMGFPKLIFPPHLGKTHKKFNVPFQIQNFMDQEIEIRMDRIEDSERYILTDRAQSLRIPPNTLREFNVKIRLPGYIEYGETKLDIRLYFLDDYRIFPRQGTLEFTYTPPAIIRFTSTLTTNTMTILLYILGFILLIFLGILLRKQFSASNFSNYLNPKKGHFPFKDSRNLIEMRVSMQNPHIGYRNIHKIDENCFFQIGGKRSDYLIFLVPFPANIAEIKNQNGKFIFTPKRMEFFPNLDGSFRNCLDKEIKVVSGKGIELTLIFSQYISPLEALNRILHSINREEKEKTD